MTVWIWQPEVRAWRPATLPANGPYGLAPLVTLLPVGGGRYGVLTTEPMRINGEPVLLLRILDDRDELRLPDGQLCYVSVDDEPEVLPFSPGAGPSRCARCGHAIEPGVPSVRCPRCLAPCHSTEDRPCWTHADTCPACSQKTRGRSWEPEPLALVEADGHAGATHA